MMKLLHFQSDFIGRPPRPMLRGKVYYIRQRIAGRDVWRSLHTRDKREAEYLALEIWRMRQTEQVKSIIPAPPRKLELIWETYTNSDRFKMLSDSTQASKSVNWNAFISWCRQRRITYPRQLTPELCVEFLERNGSRNKTFNNTLGDLRLVLNEGGADVNAFEQVDKRSTTRTTAEKQSTQFNAFSDRDVERILDYLATSDVRHRDEWIAACRIASMTGLRYKDVALLRFDSIQRDDRGPFLCLSPSKTSAKTGNRLVYIRLTSELNELLKERRTIVVGEFVLPGLHGDYLRVDKNGKSMQSQATKPFLKVCKRLGIDGSFHSFRVTFVTKAAKAGIDLEELGGVVGHSTKTQTQAYNRAALEIDISEILSASIS